MPGWQETKRFTGLPLIAAGTDVGPGPVQLVTGPVGWGVRPVEKNTEQPVGIARASAPNELPVDVRDVPDVHIAVAAASIGQGAFIGVASAHMVEGASGSFPVPQIAEVAKATNSNRWAIGVALEGAAKGAKFSYYFNPQQLSGLE